MTRGVVLLPDRAAFRQAVLLIFRHVADAAAEVPGRRAFPQSFDFINVADAQSLVPLQVVSAAQLFLASFHKITHADTSLPQ